MDWNFLHAELESILTWHPSGRNGLELVVGLHRSMHLTAVRLEKAISNINPFDVIK